MAASSSPIAATGRRKTAVVRLNLTQGSGKVQVNGRDFEDYFTTAAMRMEAMSPLNLINRAKNFDLTAKASGGGLCGQAGAMKLALARCLIVLESELRPALKKAGYLRRDPRMKERKKSGQPGARKRFQFSKR